MEYELLEALRPGRNLLWEATWQQHLAGGLLVQFRYQGRKLGDSKSIHLGSVQLQAQF